MKIKPEELSELLNNAAARNVRDAKELTSLSERVLKLEYKINELMDTLTDFRVNQIMSNSDELQSGGNSAT